MNVWIIVRCYTIWFRKYRRRILSTLAIIFLFVLCYLAEAIIEFDSNFPYVKCNFEYYTTDGYLVDSTKCRIPSLNLTKRARRYYVEKMKFDGCTSTPLLSSIVKQKNGRNILVINREVAETYSEFICCWSPIARPNFTMSLEKDWDMKISVGNCKDFNDSVVLPLNLEIVMVSCRKKYPRFRSDVTLYKNVHAIVNSLKVQNRENKTKLINNKFNKKMSILVLGIDSVSRLNFLRSLPMTSEYLRKKGWFNLKGYTTVGLNKFQNLMIIITGRGHEMAYKCNSNKPFVLDNCPIIWKNFKDAGYITAYGEDDSELSTFNYLASGFSNPPTDYYLRPYIVASEKLLDSKTNFNNKKYCTGPQSSVDRIFDCAANFSKTFLNTPYFGFFWSNTINHNEMNGVSSMDDYFLKYFDRLEHQGTLENTFVIFMSNHGTQRGGFRKTFVGEHEDKMPFIFLHIPKKYDENNEIHEALKINENRLTSHYDLYETFRDILIRAGGQADSSSGCPKSQSLFRRLPTERSCDDAGISEQWCTCMSEERTMNIDTDVIAEAGVKFFLEYTESLLEKIKNSKNERLCAHLKLKKIYYIRANFNPSDSDTTIIKRKFSIRIEVEPGGGLFDFILYVDQNNNYSIRKYEVIRRNSYVKDSKCLNNRVRKFCFCLD